MWLQRFKEKRGSRNCEKCAHVGEPSYITGMADGAEVCLCLGFCPSHFQKQGVRCFSQNRFCGILIVLETWGTGLPAQTHLENATHCTFSEVSKRALASCMSVKMHASFGLVWKFSPRFPTPGLCQQPPPPAERGRVGMSEMFVRELSASSLGNTQPRLQKRIPQ